MIRRILYTALLALAALCTTASCQKEAAFDMPLNGSERITARKAAAVTRSVPPNSYFEPDTRYRLWAYDPASEAYLFDPGADPRPNGIPALESSGQYIQMAQENAKLLRNAFVIYGFTDGSAAEEGASAPDLLPDPASDEQKPTYTLTYDSGLDRGYPDCYRAKLEYDRSQGLISPVMEFRHILSRVRVQVIQQDDGQATEEGMRTGMYDLKLHSVRIDGVHDTEVYDVRADRFSLPAGAPEAGPRVLRNTVEGMPVIPAEVSDKMYSESLLFPTLDEEKERPLTLQLVISGTDAARFSTTPAEGVDGGYVVEVPLYDRNTPGSDGRYELPLTFEPNHSYMLRVVFAQDGIVTFTPLVYPWFDGETAEWEKGGEGYEGYEGYEEQPLGNTYLFDNLIWSDRNLGASEYNPTDMAAFRKCTGFYYQYDRNIPYFPMKELDGVLTDDLTENATVYPVISDPVGRRQTPNINQNLSFLLEVDDIDPAKLADGTQYAGYNSYANGISGGPMRWNEILTQPTTPGWRLPTQDEFFGIMPTTPHAGNITFLKDGRYLQAGKVGDALCDDFYTNPNIDVIYVHVPNNPNYPNYPDDSQYVPNGGPGASGTKGDPYGNYSSEYVISRKYEGEYGSPINNVNEEGKQTIWGTIYGIKKVGTNEAYRMRWHIEQPDPTEDYYVLVIERYTATAGDRLNYSDENASNYYRKYDWSRPTAVLYFPLVGMIGESGWGERSGKVGNFGLETIFATSDPDGINAYKTFRIKITGTGRSNQFIAPSTDRRGSGAQIRMVRESTYQPNR